MSEPKEPSFIHEKANVRYREIEQVRKGGLPPLSEQRAQAALPDLLGWFVPE